jgi:uncharacterized protein with NAD-binding domain and iron-sulfur cluster
MTISAWIVLAAFVSIMLVRAARRGLQMKQLLQDGVVASAVVVSKTRFNTSPGRRFFVRYQYRDAHGVTHSRRALVTRDVYNRLNERDQVEVIYSASRPAIAALRADVEVLRKV